jgi:sugar lactone lactonase YvrE
VATDADGRVYVADYANHRIQTFDRHGQWLASWGREGSGPGEFRLPAGIAVDRHDRVYVSDSANQRIQQFDRTGRLLAQWASLGGEELRPGALAVDGQGQIVVADASRARLLRFDPATGLAAAWEAADLLGVVQPTSGLTVDGEGYVYVCGGSLHVQRFDHAGRAVARWTGDRLGRGYLLHPTSIAVDGDGDLYVADQGAGRILKFRLLRPTTG